MTAPAAPATVIVFSHDPAVREQVRTAVGRRPAADLGRSSGSRRDRRRGGRPIDAGGVDLAILDGEAQPTGGMGISRQLNDEIDDCPADLRAASAAGTTAGWRTWSLADATLARPLDPVTAAETVAQLLRDRRAALPVR